jgi:hypothetical protein
MSSLLPTCRLPPPGRRGARPPYGASKRVRGSKSEIRLAPRRATSGPIVAELLNRIPRYS